VDKEQTRVALAAQRTEVRACYAEALGRPAAGLEARAVVTLLLNREGRVIQAEVGESTPHDDLAERCVVEKAYDWRLPRPSPAGVVTLTYPFTFGRDE
jgi:TonB family protein